MKKLGLTLIKQVKDDIRDNMLKESNETQDNIQTQNKEAEEFDFTNSDVP
jgi:hypothetical protein